MIFSECFQVMDMVANVTIPCVSLYKCPRVYFNGKLCEWELVQFQLFSPALLSNEIPTA